MSAPPLVIVPALNESASVGAVVRAVREHVGADVLVLDDGSTDRTADVAASAGARVLSHPFNLGVGAALRSGFRFAAEQGYDCVVQVDGDGQHEVTDVKRLIDQLERADLDIVIGSRFESGYRVGLVRRTVMRALGRVVSRRLGTPVHDSTSGFRAFGPRAIERYARCYPSVYLSDTVEALLLAGDWDLRVAEIPVTMHQRATGVASAGPVKSAVFLARLALVVLLHRVRTPIAGQEGHDDVAT